MKRTLLGWLAVTLAMAAPMQAQIVVGDYDGDNTYPFGSTDGSRYQQAYDGSIFGGPFTITAISFFRAGTGTLVGGTYDLSFSTISANQDVLSTTDFDDNLGADNQLFGSFMLGGTAPEKLTFSGGPFNYNPGSGDLLLDMRISNQTFGFTSYQHSMDDPHISRYHDFGIGFQGRGLVTEFSGTQGPVNVPEPGSMLLLATGLIGIALRRRTLETPDA